ncbi:uncharacterized protein LOC116352222 [Contarinia nasturtii]|uniref:uncharacterized protein LOC116352222 n=1 Tax=Contarinia nasturtii TaxID=265458 RepID=UPI0012D3F82F|nr:uncharacterized protein LOC116352222 [Contarinia nasturtii]
MDAPANFVQCGLNLNTGGLIIGYFQLITSALFLKYICAPVVICVIFLLNMFLSFPWIYGLLSNKLGFMWVNIVWTSFKLSLVICASVFCGVYIVIYNIFNVIGESFDKKMIHFDDSSLELLNYGWIICTAVAALEWGLLSAMKILYKSKENETSSDTGSTNKHIFYTDNIYSFVANEKNDQTEKSHIEKISS